jgi:putative membrane protein
MSMNADEMARQRTVMAADRTLMAWIRTALSMISFGFTLSKFFQYLQESGSVRGLSNQYGPRNLGLVLVALGVVGVLGAVIHHSISLRALGYASARERMSTTVFIALLIAGIGGFVFFSVLAQVGPF